MGRERRVTWLMDGKVRTAAPSKGGRLPCGLKNDPTRPHLYTNNTISCFLGPRTWKNISIFSFTHQGPHSAA